MSRFDDIYAQSGVPTLMHQFGRSVIYHDPEVNPVTLQAIVSSVQIRETEDDQGRTLARTRTATITTDTSSVNGGVAKPSIKATVTIDGEVWAIEGIEANSGNMVALSLVATGRMDVSGGRFTRV